MSHFELYKYVKMFFFFSFWLMEQVYGQDSYHWKR